jgi:7,8-dihydropterin-6-yl-methyl-4-(beta-D-ribofuranosyl)aminobenzene 5'-phosphate synthase
MKLEVIDQCDVTVLVDNVMDIISTAPDSVTGHISNVFKAGATELSGKCLCCAHWGLSLVITAQQGGHKKTLLFDSGPEGEAVERNGDRLGIDFASIDAAMFSHGHWDHVGGMTTALRLIKTAKGGNKIPVHVNDGMFVHRGLQVGKDKYIPFEDLPSKNEIEGSGGSVNSIEGEHTLLDNMFYVSGEIPRATSYEKGIPNHVKDLGNGWEPDPLIMDERYAAVHIKDKGIAVFTACSHAGVVNVLKNAQEIFDPIPLYAVMGGFHLSGNKCEAIIPETIQDMKAFNLKTIIPGHCTGWRAVHRLVETFGESAVVMSGVGQSHSL